MSSQQIIDLRAKARRAREMANGLATEQQAVKNLKSYADDLEREADRLERELKLAHIAGQPQAQEAGAGPEAAAALIPQAPDDPETPT